MLQRLTRSGLFLLADWLVLAAGAGCTPSTPAPHHAARPTPPVSAAASPTGVPESPQAQARQAYLGMWQAYVAASKTADYQSPTLARYAAGGALSLLTHGLYQNYQDGIVTRGQPSFRPDVTITSPGSSSAQANVTDCADSSAWVNYTTSGKQAPGESRGRQQVYARLQPYFGTWKVTYLVVEKVGTC